MSSFEDIIAAIIQKSLPTKEEDIKNMYTDMKESMDVLGLIDQSEKTATEKAYLKAFMNVMSKMSKQFLEVKRKYQQIDKEKLKQQKCQKLASDIKLFRDDSFQLRTSIKQVTQSIQQEKLKLDLLTREEQGLFQAIKKVKETKNSNKQKYDMLRSVMENTDLHRVSSKSKDYQIDSPATSRPNCLQEVNHDINHGINEGGLEKQHNERARVRPKSTMESRRKYL